MKTKQDIVDNWLPRYTGTALADFGPHVLLTNFGSYLDMFAEQTGAAVVGRDRPMPNATADGITMINFSMGSANAPSTRHSDDREPRTLAVPASGPASETRASISP